MNNTLMKPFRAPREANKKETQETGANRRRACNVRVNVRDDIENALAEDRALAEDECPKVQSPCFSDFEDYFDKCDSQRKQVLKGDKNVSDHAPKPAISATQCQKDDRTGEFNYEPS
jgi:hypothetical protein